MPMSNEPTPGMTADTDGTSGALCSTFECPDKYSLVDDADEIVCKASGCTKGLCCVKDGERAVLYKPMACTGNDTHDAQLYHQRRSLRPRRPSRNRLHTNSARRGVQGGGD